MGSDCAPVGVARRTDHDLRASCVATSSRWVKANAMRSGCGVAHVPWARRSRPALTSGALAAGRRLSGAPRAGQRSGYRRRSTHRALRRRHSACRHSSPLRGRPRRTTPAPPCRSLTLRGVRSPAEGPRKRANPPVAEAERQRKDRGRRSRHPRRCAFSPPLAGRSFDRDSTRLHVPPLRGRGFVARRRRALALASRSANCLPGSA